MHKKWFNRLLLSYLPVLFVVSLSLLLITYLTLIEMSKKSALKASEILSSNIMQSLDNTLKGIEAAAVKEILDNDRIGLFFRQDHPDYNQYTDYRAAAALTEMLERNPYIHSIYLYRTAGNNVLTPSAFTSIDGFGDKRFIGLQVSSRQPFQWLDRRVYKESPNASAGTDVVSLVKFANLSDRSLMVINVSTDMLGEMIRSMSDSRLSFVELLDGKGELIAANSKAESGEADNGREWTRIRSDYTGWTIRTGTYGSNIAEWISSLFYLWIAMGIAITVAGVIWLVYVSRRNYRPLVTMKGRITDYARQRRQQLQVEEKQDELQYIETMIEHLLDHSSDLQVRDKENLSYRKRHAFLGLLEGEGAARTSNWAEELDRLEVNPDDFGLVIVSVCEMDRAVAFEKKYNRRDQLLLKQVLSSAQQEIAQHASLRIWAEWSERHRLCCIYFIPPLEDEGTAEDIVAAQSEKLREWVEQNLSFTITTSIGTHVKSLADVQQSYQTAADSLEYKVSLGDNRLIRPADLASWTIGETFRHLPSIRTICQAYRAGDIEWESGFCELEEALVRSLFTRTDALSLFHYFIYYLHKELSELPAEFQEIWSEFHPLLHEALEREETMGAVCGEFAAILENAAERMRELRESKSNHQLLKKVKAYIGEQYANTELSLAHLSGEFGLNTSYLSRLFKEEFGVKFIDYLSQVRTEKAIALLSGNEQMTNQAIAEAVGYTSVITFARVFKKITGCTPGQYRKE